VERLELVIIGSGAMGTAMGMGWKGKMIKIGTHLMELQIDISGRNRQKGEELAKKVGGRFIPISELDLTGKVVVLAVKPAGLEWVAQHITGTAQLVISVLAGRTLEQIGQIPALAHIRAMPNIGALYGSSITGIAGDRSGIPIASALFKLIGEVVEVENDQQIDMVTAITGSGPAYLALIREAIEDGGVYIGLTREVSQKLAEGLFKSFGKIQQKSCIIKEKVMSPAGTTAEGIFRLEREGVRGIIMDAIREGYQKAGKIQQIKQKASFRRDLKD